MIIDILTIFMFLIQANYLTQIYFFNRTKFIQLK